MNPSSDLLAAWGCPPLYCGSEPPQPSIGDYQVAEAFRAVRAAANWYAEHDTALLAMIAAGDAAAIRDWADSAQWERIAEETGDRDGDEEAASAYCQTVREALWWLAGVLPEPESEGDEECEHRVIERVPVEATGGGFAFVRRCADCGADIDADTDE